MRCIVVVLCLLCLGGMASANVFYDNIGSCAQNSVLLVNDFGLLSGEVVNSLHFPVFGKCDYSEVSFADVEIRIYGGDCVHFVESGNRAANESKKAAVGKGSIISMQAIPEPVSFSLLLVGSIFALYKRR